MEMSFTVFFLASVQLLVEESNNTLIGIMDEDG